MTPAHAGDLLHGLDPGAQGGGAPGVQELAGPGGGLVGPQLLEVFLQQVGADAFQVVTQQLLQSPLLIDREIPGAFEKTPTSFLQDRLTAVTRKRPGLLGAHVIQGVVHLGDDMETVEDMHGLGTALADHPDVGSPQT